MPQKNSSSASLPIRQEWIADVLNHLAKRTISQVETIDMYLMTLAGLLDSAQPQRPGKIGLRFWRDKSRPEGKIPYLFRWEKRLSGEWHAKPLSLKYLSGRNRKRGDFQPTAKEVSAVLKLISQLMVIRQKLLGGIGIMRRSITQRLNKSQTQVDDMALDLIAAQEEIKTHPYLRVLLRNRKSADDDSEKHCLETTKNVQ
ncbi:MAG: hypothetical protein EKK46_09415 [Rhodocyclaceae bacterium]|nr:MAG: hypothetical protein EKK46_09415 [Rhodocyclaceae bacterium]